MVVGKSSGVNSHMLLKPKHRPNLPIRDTITIAVLTPGRTAGIQENEKLAPPAVSLAPK